ncbi:Pyruvate/2-oxoglutarate dehydrogenase complex, dihydrolipoamide acyltransferase (E2) component, and related enzymes [plant metagenome]|uniref:Pyruvate/2-oxoglutarate dehydrogenase complex, dihydrolipoamide acyltransferase (E2) component, and related enzymes n=1 Tax=plant metagenome TaxID=1297885 RepID=A0A484S5I8_9ZZZZ
MWHPWHGPLRQPYRFRYRDDREYRLHSAATGLLYRQLLDGPLLDWLSGYPALWGPLLYVLAGQYEHAGVLGELVVQADRASVAQELGGDPARAMAAPKHALQRKLLEGLRYLLKEELKLNQPEASDGWLTEDALWLVSKTVSDKLRAHLLSQGIDGIPANNTAVFNVLQDHGMLQPTPDGKAIWRATISSDSGWSHSFTLLRLAPALVWESGERPEPFAGTVALEATPADADADAQVEASVATTQPATAPEEISSAPINPPQGPPSKGTGIPDAMEDMLAMVSGSARTTPMVLKEEVPDAVPPSPPEAEVLISRQTVPATAPSAEPAPQPTGIRGTATLGRTLHGMAAGRYCRAPAHHQRRQGTGTYRERYCVLDQPRRFPALRSGTSTGRHDRQTGGPARLAVGAKALRAAASAPQTCQRPEHLDLRRHRSEEVTPITWLSASGPRSTLRRNPAQQSLSPNALTKV